MQKPLCKFCGTRDHHQSEMHLCKAMKSERVDATDSDRDDPVNLVAVSNPPPKPRRDQSRSTGHSEPEREQLATGGERVSMESPGMVLTNAQRCKRYREKNRERVLRADRARKAKIRGSPSE